MAPREKYSAENEPRGLISAVGYKHKVISTVHMLGSIHTGEGQSNGDTRSKTAPK